MKVPTCCPKCGGRKLEVELVAWGVWFDGIFEKEINTDAGYDVESLNRPLMYCPECEHQTVIEPEVKRYGS